MILEDNKSGDLVWPAIRKEIRTCSTVPFHMPKTCYEVVCATCVIQENVKASDLVGKNTGVVRDVLHSVV